ncbi:MAG: chorismate synthase [Myxococcales bacterium]|nr:chorismate synthase [Myxococcales bacterium]
MSGNSAGLLFRVTTWGESHGPALGVVVDGCPPGLALNLDAVQAELDRRRPGQSRLTTQRQEADQVEVLSGVFEGRTTGTPISLLIRNADQRSRDYSGVAELYRPGHADFTYDARFGHRDHRGGGRSSARETAARVAAAAIARQWLAARFGVQVLAWVDRVADCTAAPVDEATLTHEAVDAHPARGPDPASSEAMAQVIEAARKAGDTVGGTVRGLARGLPAGWGAPVFDRLEADIGKHCLSLPACKGVEFGSGFAGTYARGSTHNDAFAPGPQGPVPTTNNAGGTLGGISTGAPLTVRCAFKPVSTHFQPQQTVTAAGQAVTFQNKGRHDPCVLPRAVPLVEAAILLPLMDHALRTLALGR